MQSFQAAFNLDLHGFVLWTSICIGGYAAYLGLSAAASALEAGAKRKLNNQVRHDLYLSLLNKNHSEYHGQDKGEYLSWLSTNIKQITSLGWTPFFDISNRIAMIICCVAALLALNWVLLAFGVVSASIMLTLPKLVTKKMERLGQACANAEAQGISQIKDLLSGFDVLCSFGRTSRFVMQGDAASDKMEAASFKMGAMQSYVSCGVGFVSICLQCLQQIVTVVLAIGGKMSIGAVVSASNLTAGIANSLSAIASNRIAMASAKPYFQNITTHSDKIRTERMSGMTPVKTNRQAPTSLPVCLIIIIVFFGKIHPFPKCSLAFAVALVQNQIIDLDHIQLALQGYNFGSAYITWALQKYGEYSRANAIEFSLKMAEQMGWNSYGDKQYVPHVLRYYPIGKVFYNPEGGDAIVDVALTQVGNVGGEPYWSWYGFTNHVEWCACFVSWCADQCGYLDSGAYAWNAHLLRLGNPGRSAGPCGHCGKGGEWNGLYCGGQFQGYA